MIEVRFSAAHFLHTRCEKALFIGVAADYECVALPTELLRL